jgi:SMI1 / KNR4 family.
MKKWRYLIEKLSVNLSCVTLNPSAAETQIREVEEALKITLPNDIKECLSEFNGDNWLILSTSQIIEINSDVRNISGFMPLDCLLFIAGNGCGDYYGYPITGDGIKDGDLFMWDHENDNRLWVANDLEELINRYFKDEI